MWKPPPLPAVAVAVLVGACNRHLQLEVRTKGVTRFVDDEAVPRRAQLRHREIGGLDPFAIGHLLGRMIGLRTGGGYPPAFEYRPLLDALVPHGDLVVHKVRRAK